MNQSTTSRKFYQNSENQSNMGKSKKADEQDQQYYLNTVIDCIVENKNSPKSIESPSMAVLRKRRNKLNQNPSENSNNEKEFNLPQLYGKAGQLVAEFDNSINRCKKYNEAKVNRKYQIVIKDLEAEIRKLTQKLKLQQQARSPTKKHISEILDKLVSYKDENQMLRKELAQSQRKLQELQGKIETQANALLKMQSQNKTTIERLPAIGNQSLLGSQNSAMGSVIEDVKAYLKDKEKVRLINGNPPSNLEKYLNTNRAKMWNWNVANLLEELDKWAQGVKQRQEVDMWRIRSGIARKFSDIIDDPSVLVAPSVLTSIKTQKNYISPPIYSEPQKKKRFSAFDFKSNRSKSIIDSKRQLESSLS